MSDADEQTDELLALASIYDESAFTSQTDGEHLTTGTLQGAVEVSQPLLVTLAGKGDKLTFITLHCCLRTVVNL